MRRSATAKSMLSPARKEAVMNTPSESFAAKLDATPWAEVGQPRIHESAVLHVLGEATYTDDVPELRGTLHAALGLSQKAHARVNGINFDAVKRCPGVFAVLTAADITGTNDCGPILHDDPILADGLVQ